jgi:hypothetical protein
MSSAPTIPGLYFTTAPQAPTPSPLRTDVAGFFGRTLRGPVGVATRVKGWREYLRAFGNVAAGAMSSYALRGYFDNGGDVAYVVRVLGQGSACAVATWQAGTYDPAVQQLNPDWPGASGFPAIQFALQAKSPGTWANDTSVNIRYWARGISGKPEVELEVSPPGEDTEILSGLQPASLVDDVNLASQYVSMQAQPWPPGLTAAQMTAKPGPNYFAWPPVKLSGGISVPATKKNYLAALTALGDEIEVALVVSPDLYSSDNYRPDLYPAGNPSRYDDVVEIIQAMLQQAEQLHDRLVVLDIPLDQADPIAAVQWLDSYFRDPDVAVEPLSEYRLRNCAVYHPRLLVPDPLGSAAAPLLCVPNSGLVTGVISRLDQQEGAYLTPANAPIKEAVDLSQVLDANQQTVIYQGGINLLTCSPSQGLLVWGGRVLGVRTKDPSAPGKKKLGGYVAHRRLIHLLVKAIRRVAEPLVFDVNGPPTWLALVRCITTVLLEAYRAGALQGDTPDQAFRVQCDTTTNPPEQIEQGILICLVQVAPAVPMEFITLRIAVSAQGQLEVFET